MAPAKTVLTSNAPKPIYPAPVPGRGVQWHGLLLMDNFAAMNETYDEFITSWPYMRRCCPAAHGSDVEIECTAYLNAPSASGKL
ncbi:hypothetical protein QBC32DRAFT_315567 [Pseudoneurospora amorphoporcata]|uniref:Uncharacterized protein n=1 Tax=Pseudoneurospora amorphoporcata TaxID=241081 RepID=A0AAN6SF10_9PEZI|nr:hypothetical protein QBC32DRAFT_315567 [Pseudoneurospora amorphoporcata]